MVKRWHVLPVFIAALAFAAPAAAAPDSGPAEATRSDAGASDSSGRATYIVELMGEPAATYAGGIAGLEATSIAVTGAGRLDSQADATVQYVEYLLAGHEAFADELAEALGRPVHILLNYRYVLNGVAVELTEAEAAVVAGMPDVTVVEKGREFRLDTDAGPKWIGAPGIWDGSAVPTGVGTMGEGVIVGVIDTGINADHPSFDAVGADGYEHTNPFGEGRYKGYCDSEHPSHDPVRYPCNAKLVGMWSFETSGNDAEDDHGHGSHTAGTAAGNFVTATLLAPTVRITTALQGVAPHANIITYDTCTPDGFCQEPSMIAAIDQAVDDQVHVTNFSIGGPTDNDEPWHDTNLREKGWRNLRAAGIWAAVSAGNAGPAPASTAKISPWETGVGASTHNRVVQNLLADMSGGEMAPPANMVGQSITDGYGPARIVYALGRLHADGSADDGQCNTPFPPGTFTSGEIVACDRGIIPRTEKGTNVLAGGAGGLALMNAATNGSALVADDHELPAVNLTYNDGVLLKAWLGTGSGHMATITGVVFNTDMANGDIMAPFSSRGWSVINTCCVRPWGALGTRWVDLLKPDVTAPGVNIWAPAATDREDPATLPEYQFLSGTSMSGPHVAGAFALLRSLHPEWTPAQGQSALMLTSVTDGILKQDGTTPADPFDRGAGRINLSSAANAGFVLDMTLDEAMAQNPSAGGDPSTLNVASMANFRCLGTCGWTRTVTSTWDTAITWDVSAEGASGLALTVEPESFTLEPGGTQTIRVEADVTDVVTDTYAFGEVDFTPTEPGPAAAHMPVAVRAPRYALPPMVVSETPVYAIASGTANGTWVIDGIRSLPLDDLTAMPAGLVVPDLAEAELPQDPTANTPFDLITSTATITFTVPEGALRLTAELLANDSQNANLWVGVDANNNGVAEQTELRCQGNSASNMELCRLYNPTPAGAWWVMLQNLTPSAPDAVDRIPVLYGVVTPGDANLTAELPDSVDGTAPWSLDLGWDLEGVEAGDIAYGTVIVNDGDTPLFTMQVDVNITESPPSVYLPSLGNRFDRGAAVPTAVHRGT